MQTQSQSQKMTAPAIRALAEAVNLAARGSLPCDLRLVPEALATTGARTEAARVALRGALASLDAVREAAQRLALAVRETGLADMRAANRAATFPARLAAYKASLTARAVRTAYDRCSYRTSRSGWAGGNHTVGISTGAPAASGATSKAWSPNGKWSGTDSRHEIVVSPEWREIPEAARVVDGLLTLWAAPLRDDDIFEAVWVEQSRGVSLTARRGYIVLRGLSWAAHATTLAGARRAIAA